MTSRGWFGIALAHSRRRIEELFETARVAEQAGADVLTLADHPYLPNELETWTMLTMLAARTERVAVAPNVVNLGLRPPVMLAKAAATLQVVSGGRLVLGVGAGDPDGTAALGGPRRSGPEAVAALEEGLGLLRRLWDPAAGEIDHSGQFYRASGVRFGPVPAPGVPLWIGAFGQRMLALTGRYGDGWIPTNAYLNLADVPAMQRRIDHAATEAGRDPAQIRRVFNVIGQITETEPHENGRRLVGPVDFWVGALRDYRDRLGFDSFVFWPNSDRPGQTRLFLERVRPRLELAGSAVTNG